MSWKPGDQGNKPERIREQVEQVAMPLAIYCLMWLFTNPDERWRRDR